MNRYNIYSQFLKETYGEKVYKLPISIPDTCPNRDGTLGTQGCVFCGSIGAGYENLPASVTITQQIQTNIAHIAPKYKAYKYIAYFQNFTNTYIPPQVFREYLEEACQPGIVGIAIATRPDCLHPAYLDIMEKKFKSGFVAVVGRPNVGKSTLINHIIRQKVTIVSDKAQTTRNRILCIHTDEECQIVFLDTPGIHKPKHKLGQFMDETAYQSLKDIDAVLFLVSGNEKKGPGDQFVLDKLKDVGVPVFLLINKIDLMVMDSNGGRF